MLEKIRELCYVWQLRLGLRDWDILVNLASHDEIQGWGHVEWNLTEKVADIKLMHTGEICPSSIRPYDIETTLVHELLHLHFAPLGVEDGSPQELAAEQAINAIAKALVKKHNLASYEVRERQDERIIALGIKHNLGTSEVREKREQP